MKEWYRRVQEIIAGIDACIRAHAGDELTLENISRSMGYSPFWFSRKFREISGMQLRDYIRLRKLAFALKEMRDTDRDIIDIALDHGFSSQESFTRSFREAYGITPGDYRKNPVPVALRTILRPFDCYIIDNGGTTMADTQGDVKVYFVTIPQHRFLHIRNYESIGYWDFWQKQSLIPGQDCETVCGILDSIPGKLDDNGGSSNDSGSGQIMGFLNDAAGRICSWGIPLAECYGVRVAADYAGPVPEGMYLTDVPEGEYIVFEHGPFDFQTQNAAVEQKIEDAMRAFDYAQTPYELDMTPGRLFYFYHDCERFWKYVRPVKRKQ